MRRKTAVLLLALILLCVGCISRDEKITLPEYQVYYPAARGNREGAALDSEIQTIPPGRGAVEGLMYRLLTGPESDNTLVSPFPAGTELRSWRVKDGVAQIDLSEAYGGLSGVDMSLADGCIVMTLCQLDRVEAVYITVEGRARPFRDQVLRPSSFVLKNGTGQPVQMNIQLCFPQFLGDGAPGWEERVLTLSVGDDPAVAAVQAWLEGPEDPALVPGAPRGTRLRGLRREKDAFYVDLSSAWDRGKGTEAGLESLSHTLNRLEPGMGVVLLVEGQRLEQLGELDLTVPLLPPAVSEEP